jgi:trk system potassium uptake protein TrkH
MQLKRFVTPVRKLVVLDNLFQLLWLFGYLLIPPLLVSLLFHEFLYTSLIAAEILFCFAPRLLRYKKGVLNLATTEALVVTALAYLLFSILGAILFLPISPFVDGLFEAMSGITTTGLSVMQVESLPVTLLFFRSYSQWIGGAGIVIVSLTLLMGPGLSAFRLYASEYGETNLAGDVKSTAKTVIKIYLTLTVLGFIAFWASGMDIFHALLHIMSTVSTGGFSTHNASIGAYSSHVIRIVVLFFMLAGAISFVSYHALQNRKWRDFFLDPQLKALGFVIIGTVMVFFLTEGFLLTNLTNVLFHVASAVSTTGFGLSDCATWPAATKFTTILVMFVGGGAGSTAGGIKLFRLFVVLHLIKRLATRMLLPAEAKISFTYNQRVIKDGEIMAAGGIVVLYLLFIGFTSLSLTAAGIEIGNAIFESTSALGTVGLSVGVTSHTLPTWTKLLLTLNMWAGRLEILPVVILLYPHIWKCKRRQA